jgi:hypothetical protein
MRALTVDLPYPVIIACMTHATESAPLISHELAECFRRLALLTNDEELAERMLRHAEEAEHEGARPRKKASRH